MSGVLTFYVHTGYGIHPYWLFREPVPLDTPAKHAAAAAIAAAWVGMLQRRAADRQWKCDSVGDLARVLRVPGTSNHKIVRPDKPIATIVQYSGEMYGLEDFQREIAAAGESRRNKDHSASGSPVASDRARIIERCRRYIAKMEPAIQGQAGSIPAFSVACTIFRFGLTDTDARQVFDEYNARCVPPWSEREIEHKLKDAREKVTQANEVGVMLRNERRPAIGGDSSSSGASGDHSGGETSTNSTREPPSFTKLISSAELLDLDCTITYLVDDAVVEQQPLVIGGASKAMKTSIMVDLAISLATGTPFLTRFASRKRRIAIWSGESGAATLKNSMSRIARSRGVDPRDADLFWNFEVPKLSWPEHLIWMERTIVDNGLEVVFIDPLYLALLDARSANQASNVYAMGAALWPLSELGRKTGCTIGVAHHNRRTAVANDDEPAALESLSQSGIVEWARQWLLLQRRSPYQGDGRHELHLRAGGSAGHAGLWAVDIDEGVRDRSAADGDGRYWSVEIRNVGDARRAAQDEAAQRKQRAAQDRQAAQDEIDVGKLTKAMATYPEGQTLRAIRDAAGINGARGAKALQAMIGTGHAVPCKVVKNKREEDGFRYIEKPGSISGGTRWDTVGLTSRTATEPTKPPATPPKLVNANQSNSSDCHGPARCVSIGWFHVGQSMTIELDGVPVTVKLVARKGRRARIAITSR